MTAVLPWDPRRSPLMLAPMQGLTNRALRGLFIEKAQPDTVFTEFVRVQPGGGHAISNSDRKEVQHREAGTPLVVQLIGKDNDALVAAAVEAQEYGAAHININMGCPYTRRGRNGAGGALLRHPAQLRDTLDQLRSVISGSFSVKLRSGYDESDEVFALLPHFEAARVDFLILHARTVVQKYKGPADHAITKQVCARTKLPVIANGDVTSAAFGHRLLQDTGAAGLMLARGAIADPWLFQRLRGERPAQISDQLRRRELGEYLRALRVRLLDLFSDDTIVLYRLKDVLNQVDDECFERERLALRRCKRLDKFTSILQTLD